MTALLSHRLLVVTGKGGVGKTTVAAALGLVAARAGKRTIVAEVARRGDVASAFDRDGSEPFEEIELAEGLFHISIDPQEALQKYLRDQLPHARSPTSSPAAGSSACSPSDTGHARAADRRQALGARAARPSHPRRRPLRPRRRRRARDRPRRRGADGAATFAAAAGSGPVARQGKKIDATLSDPSQTAAVAVARAENSRSPRPASCARRCARAWASSRAVIANALDPDRFDDREAKALAPHGEHPAVARVLPPGQGIAGRPRLRVRRDRHESRRRGAREVAQNTPAT